MNSATGLCIFDARRIASKHVTTQKELLMWDAWRRARSLRSRGAAGTDAEEQALYHEILATRERVIGGWIDTRGHETSDFLHRDIDRMEIYHDRRPEGATLGERQRIAKALLTEIFEQRFYPEGSTAPDALVFISHAAFSIPCAAHNLVNARGWGHGTRVYSMCGAGCTSSLQAIRMARGIGPSAERPTGWRVDVAVAELLTLHSVMSDPEWRSTESIIAPSCGDGLNRFSISDDPADQPHLKILASQERLLPAIDSVGFALGSSGAELSIDPTVAFKIVRVLKPFTDELCRKAGFEFTEEKDKLVFAGYFGPPTLTDVVLPRLSLSSEQGRHTIGIARKYGAIGASSLPHIWSAILDDRSIQPGTRILCLAAGPGILLTGCILERGGGST
jgi:predicted naringenin-chalcone synthase